ncbi:MAG: hypothetical protein ACOZNI_03360 [Myxococcota bacterium]
MYRAAWLSLLIACDSGDIGSTQVEDDDFVEETDEDPPVIEHEPITDAMPWGQDISVQATVTDGEDGEGVFMVTLYYKAETASWADGNSVQMGGAGDLWQGTIPGDDHAGSGLNYYIEATDKAQNAALDPERGEEDPYHIRLY